MTSPRILMQVQAENYRDHGANGEVDPAVMADMGFTPFDEIQDVIESAKKADALRQQASVSVLGRRALTSAEQNANYARALREHKERTVKQVIDPDLN